MNILVASDQKPIQKTALELLTHRGIGVQSIMIVSRGIDAARQISLREYHIFLTHPRLEDGFDVPILLTNAKIINPELRILLMAEALGPCLTSVLKRVGGEIGFLSTHLEYGLKQSELIQ